MKVLYSTQSVVEFDGHHFYSNAINATYPRYLTLGEKLTVLCHYKKCDIPQSDMIPDNVIRFVFINKLNTLKNLLLGHRKIEQVIKEEVYNTDVCVVHMNIHAPIVVKYAIKYNKPLLSVVGACAWDGYWNYNWKGKLIAPWAFLKIRNAQKKIPYSIYVTSSFLQHRYPTNGKWIACSNVNISTNDPDALTKRLKKIENLDGGKRIMKVATSAALNVPYKGQRYVIEAIKQLKDQGIIMEYHLIGRGNDNALRKKANTCGVADQVFIHGAIPHEKVLDFLDSMDIYVQPSKQEGLPRALIEAMSRGCLCLGSNIAGIPELLESPYLFAKGKSNKIAEILKNVTINDLRIQAKRNIEVAREYDKDLLDDKRRKFILMFKNSLI